MGSLKDPKTWIPHINPKDCSKKVCNIYCTKWCKYVILSSPPPPPPPPSPLVKDGLGGTFVSPVVIVIIALIGTLLLLIGYYVIISRYCSRNNRSSSSMMVARVVENQEITHDRANHADHADDHAIYVPWLVLGKGLDEALIKSITICKYKRHDGLVTCTDCSVCLGEFQENESLRLLPKCCHAFHVACIDTWFKTHSNCPLCRANVCFDVKDLSIISPSIPPPPPPPPMTNEIRDEGERRIRRSKSMDHYLCQTRVSTPKVMFFDQAKNMVQEEAGFQADVGSSRNGAKENNLGLKIVNVSHFGMKRSYSSGRYSFTR